MKRMKKVLISLCMVLAIMVVTVVPAFADGGMFKDTDPNAWYYDYVVDVAEKGLMVGYGNGEFGVNDVLTREQFATVLYRFDGEPEATYNGAFSDVKAGEYYSEAVSWANEHGIIYGYGNGEFGVGNTLTREQMVTIVFRYAGYRGLNITDSEKLDDFADYNKISVFAREAFEWSVAVGIISGTGDSKLDPQGAVTRTQCAAIFSRFDGIKEVLSTYTITYNLAGGVMPDGVTNPATYTKDTDTFTLNNPVRTGWTFKGWLGNGLAPETTVTIEKGSTGHRVYTAVWEANKYTVKFDGNGATAGEMEDQTFVYDIGWALNKNAFEKEGYNFNGWNTKADGTGESYKDKAWVTNLATDGEVTLYAQWTEEEIEVPELTEFTITYIYGGGEAENPASYNVETPTFTLNNPVRTGWTFAGWVGSNGLVPQTTVTIEKGTVGDLIFTATWKANTYTVTYKANGGVGEDVIQNVTHGNHESWLIKSSDLFTREGFNFANWNTEANGTGVSFAADALVTEFGDLTLYAQWEEIAPPPHVHNWTENRQEIFHEEEGYWEEYVVEEAWTEYIPVYGLLFADVCDQCGADITDVYEEHFRESRNKFIAGEIEFDEMCRTKTSTATGETGIIGYEEKYHPAVTDTRYVVTREAYTEVRITYVCDCGLVRSEAP